MKFRPHLLLTCLCALFLCISFTYLQSGSWPPSLWAQTAAPAPPKAAATPSTGAPAAGAPAVSSPAVGAPAASAPATPAAGTPTNSAATTGAAVAGGSRTVAVPADVQARLNSDVQALTRFPSRVPGTAGHTAATAYVEKSFQTIFGASAVQAETYGVTVPVTKSATLTLGGRALAVNPVYPNHVAPSSTPPEGISGPLVYAGAGKPVDFNGQVIKDAIVVLDFNSGLNWIVAADLGAKAVVFLEPQSQGGLAPTNRGEAERKFAALPVEMPRFYAAGATAAALRAAGARNPNADPAQNATMPPQAVALGDGTLKSSVMWTRVDVKNILGRIQGTDAKIAGGPGGTLVINGYFDSMAITPDLAPGAEAAGNCAALLELARYFKQNPPKYNLLFVANGAHHVALAGVRNFLAKHFIDATGKADKTMKDEIAGYRAFIGLDLTSRTSTVGLFAKSSFYNQMTVASENILLNQFSDFAKSLNAYAAEMAKQQSVKEEKFYVDGVTGREGRTWRSYLPSLVALDSEAATMAQKPGISFATANDARVLQDTPFDTVDRMNLPNLAQQVMTIRALLGKGMANIEDLPESDTFSLNFGHVVGRSIYRNVREGASFLPNTPLPDEQLLSIPADDKASNASLTEDQRLAKAKEDEVARAKMQGATAVGYVLNTAQNYKSYSGVRGAFVERAQFSKSDKAAKPIAQFVFIGPRVGDPKGGGTLENEIEAYSVNNAGHITFAPDMGSERQRFSPMFKKATPALAFKDEKLGQYNVDATVMTFECRATTLYDTLDQRYFSILREMTILDGQTDANPVEFGFLKPALPPGIADAEPVAIVYSKPNARFKLIMAAGLLGKRLVLLQTQPTTGDKANIIVPEGSGFAVPDDINANSVVHVSYQTARDLWTLDQQRIFLLKKFGINNERVDKLHGDAGGTTKESDSKPTGGALAAADKALADKEYDKFYLESRRAFGLESRAYPDVEGTAQDVLKGIIFYLALLLPFSFFLERLLFGFPDIRKQIFGTSTVFLIIFAGIRMVHPAFELAMTPFIILLAFIILALTVVVTSYLSGKFEAEIKRLKQGVHFADVGRLSAIGAALGLGIANMRRRPMRTALTCVTLVLLTFTVLSFTSVTANISNFARPYGDSERDSAYQGLMVRQPDWSAMQLSAVNSMRNEFEQRFGNVAPRAWYLSRDQGEALQLRLNNVEDPNKYFYAPALLGLTSKEAAIGSPLPKTLIAGKWFDDTRSDVCILPASMLRAPDQPSSASSEAVAETGPPLGFGINDWQGKKVQVNGQVFEVIGVYDNEKFYQLRDLDDEQFTPVDYQNEQNKQSQQSTTLAGQRGDEAEVQRYQHMDANALVMIPYDTTLDMGGTARSLAAGFRDPQSGKAELDGLMNRAALGIFGATPNAEGKLRTALYSSVETTGYGGFAALAVPILIAALIIANTMLGSVFERTREIGIYSSVGLAPIHVAALFIAEAMVYAVLGSISGYLIAQLVAKVITSTNWLQGITLNYSSSSAVISTLIVMATVLLSTLYPAWAASRMSNPDTDRRWRVREPIGDIWRFQFPFTVSGLQPLGVAQFLTDFFETHTDTSVGKFYTDKVNFTALSLSDAVAVLNSGLTPEAIQAAERSQIQAEEKRRAKAAKAAAKKAARLKEPEEDGAPNGGAANGSAAVAVRPSSAAGGAAAIINLAEIPADPQTEVYRLAMRVWLAPFDMGVSQDTDIILLPANEPGLYELQLRLVRQSGEIAAWKRVNRQFIGDLRKQLLVWRTVTPEGKQEYILRGRAHVTGQHVPSEIPGAAVGTGAHAGSGVH